MATELEQSDDAKQRFNDAISANCRYLPSRIALGKAFLLTDDYRKARSEFDDAIEIDPSNADLYVMRASAYRCLKQQDKAEQDATLALKLEPANKNAHFERGLARLGLKHPNTSGALADLEQAAQRLPKSPDARFAHGRVLEKMNRLSDATTEYDAALSLNPKLEAARAARFRLACQTKNHPVIVAELRQRLSSDFFMDDEQRREAIRQRGNSYLAMEEYKAAEADFSRLIADNDSDVPAYRARSTALRAQGKSSAADADIAAVQSVVEASKKTQVAAARSSINRVESVFNRGTGFETPAYRGYGGYQSNQPASQARATGAARRQLRDYRMKMARQVYYLAP